MEALKNITEDFNLLPLNGPVITAKILVALICGLFIAWIYRRTYRGPGYSVAYTNALILLAMTTAVVIMVIGNNLARAFGLVGAMSLVRFRHAVKNTHDIVFVFLALASGMAAGVGFYTIALLGTLLIGIVIYILSKSKYVVPHREDYLLQFNYRPDNEKIPPYQTILDEQCRKLSIINVRSLGETDLIELSYYVKLKNKDKGKELVQALNQTPGVQYVNLFFDEEQI
jgi:uncharacterized membrane protein YhiD involved in acid resistance